MTSGHLRLVVDNVRRVPPACDDAYLEFCDALRRWHAVRPHNPRHSFRLDAFAAFERYEPDVAATLDRQTWGFN